MRRMWQGLILVAAMGCASGGARAGAGVAVPAHEDAPPAGAKVVIPENRVGSPEDEALKDLLRQRTSRKGITLSSGPLTQPHKVVGAVNVEATAVPGDPAPKPGPNLYLNELLRRKAVELYGEDAVDGIMGIRYEPAADGKMGASGTAVHFENP